MRRHLVLFVRAPALARGKRRLAHEIGDVAALRFQRLMITRLLRRLGNDPRWYLRIAVTPDQACRQTQAWHPAAAVTGQGRGDLGARMAHAIAATPPGPVVLIGSDVPAVEARHIAVAFRLLGSCDLVFGPARDGGFWLVGARRRPRLPAPLFADVRWSSPYALADTLGGLSQYVTVGFVETLEDVDDRAGYRRLNPLRGF
jgi:rSAM/selenodomain-associated transferase 1